MNPTVLRQGLLCVRGSLDSDASPRYICSPALRRSSQPQANIPSGPLERAYDIKYYSRDVRRAPDATAVPIEASFTPAARARLLPSGLIATPHVGSPGAANPAVTRYDPTGLRTAMTTSQAATDREIARHRGTHFPVPKWAHDVDSAAWLAAAAADGRPVAGRPEKKRLQTWSYTQSQEW